MIQYSCRAFCRTTVADRTLHVRPDLDCWI